MVEGRIELGAKLQSNTLAASPFAAGSLFAILKVDGVPPRAIAAVVKHLANGRRVLRDVGVIRSHGALLHRQMVLMSRQLRGIDKWFPCLNKCERGYLTTVSRIGYTDADVLRR